MAKQQKIRLFLPLAENPTLHINWIYPDTPRAMFSDKLLSLLQHLSGRQRSRLRKFLQSPYFNEQERVLQLFDLCDGALRQGPEAVAELDKTFVWAHLYPGERLDEAQLRRLSSELTQLSLDFLAQEHRREHPAGDWLYLQQHLERPELHKHLGAVERRLQRYFDAADGPSDRMYLEQFHLHWNVFERASKGATNSGYLDNLLPAEYHLDCFYLLQKLKMYVAGLSYRNIRSAERQPELPPGFWEYVADERFQNAPMLQIYRRVARCLEHRDQDEHFQALLEDLERRGDAMAQEDLRACYHFAQNYCALKINEGKTNYYNAVFQVYNKMIDRAVLLEDGQLAEGFFKNIITAGLRVQAFDWVERFIREYADFLPASIRENARSYNLANVYSHRRQYDKVIELLATVEYSDVTYALGGKLILLRTYYETDEYWALDSLIQSFRTYLRRNKLISKSVLREYGNFLNTLKKLPSMHGASKPDIDRFRQKVLDNRALVSKKWLLEKIDAL